VGARVEKFEDLIAWQRARALTKEIYLMTRPGSFARDFGLTNQIQRAAVSVMSNIAEGFERGGRGEFHNFLVVAKGSTGELLSQLFVVLDVGHISTEEFDKLRALADEVRRVVGGLRVAVARQRDEQRK
jgi:four helix bundle protein